MYLAIFFAITWLSIITISHACTLRPCEAGTIMCVGPNGLGSMCEGYRGCHKICPSGTFTGHLKTDVKGPDPKRCKPDDHVCYENEVCCNHKSVCAPYNSKKSRCTPMVSASLRKIVPEFQKCRDISGHALGRCASGHECLGKIHYEGKDLKRSIEWICTTKERCAFTSGFRHCFSGIEIDNTLLLETCGGNNCVCEGYPDPNTRQALLKGHITLQRCAAACAKRNLCFGIEYWEKPRTDIPNDGDYPNCFICAPDPRKRHTVTAVDVSKLSKSQSGNWANVYVKERQDISNQDTVKCGIPGTRARSCRVCQEKYGPAGCRGENCYSVRQGRKTLCFNKRPGCGEKGSSCRVVQGGSKQGSCCPSLKCRKNGKRGKFTCKAKRSCFQYKCPKGWYCSGLKMSCRRCRDYYRIRVPKDCKAWIKKGKKYGSKKVKWGKPMPSNWSGNWCSSHSDCGGRKQCCMRVCRTRCS